MAVTPRRLEIYRTSHGQEPFKDWIEELDIVDRARIQKRLDRLRDGNPGDAKSVGEGVVELRFKFGAGYRIYIGQDGPEIVILLCGGDKSRQDDDIAAAKRYWRDYKNREKEDG